MTMLLHATKRASFLLLATLTVSACAQAQPAPSGAPDPIAVLTAGGGASHDFDRWFHEEDAGVLEEAGMHAAYTDMPAHILPALDTLDVLRIVTNQPMTAPELHEGVFYFVGAGKGLVIGHPGAWYNWSNWPEYNRELVGGGARSHRQYGAFTVQVIEPDHPVMAGVPAEFIIEDELYRSERDPDGSSIHVLAKAEEVETGETYPIVWTVHRTNGRIVVNTLGHDGAAHQHPAYARILRNSVEWAARRTP